MLLEPDEPRTVLAMLGLEPDNLLALLALLGLLRALENSRPEWRPRAFWNGPPWVAQLNLGEQASQKEVAEAADQGVIGISSHIKLDDERKNVDFDLKEYRKCAKARQTKEFDARFLVALTSECAPKKDGGLTASPLVMMFGQGHQNFIERIVAISTADGSGSKLAEKIEEALFNSWNREDDADGFRWDSEEDKRYALQFREPSKEGAAFTVIGANRLAAVGFLSFATVSRERRIRTVGSRYDHDVWRFVWPIWEKALSLGCIEGLLNHPSLLHGQLEDLRSLGVAQIMQAQRVANGKLMNVVRARPIDR